MLDPNKEDLVVLPVKAWRDFTWRLITTAIHRPGATIEAVRAEIKPILDLEAVAEYSVPPQPPGRA